MPWVRLEDKFYNHPKLAAIPPDLMLPAVGLHVLALCYCNDHLTDGFIYESQVARLAGDVSMLLPSGSASVLVKALVTVGLWEVATNGYRIHDYLEYNFSRRHVLAERKKITSERIRAGREGAKRRWERQTPHLHRLTDSKPIANSMANAWQNDGPIPIPTPTETKSKTRSTTTTRTVLADDAFLSALKANPAYQGIDIDREIGKLDAWLLTPRGRGKQKTQGRIVNWLNRVERPVLAVSSTRPPARNPNHSKSCECDACYGR